MSERNTGFHLIYYNRRLNVRQKYWVSPCIFILQQEAKCQIEILGFTLYITMGGVRLHIVREILSLALYIVNGLKFVTHRVMLNGSMYVNAAACNFHLIEFVWCMLIVIVF